jgi:hypothetical protein
VPELLSISPFAGQGHIPLPNFTPREKESRGVGEGKFLKGTGEVGEKRGHPTE